MTILHKEEQYRNMDWETYIDDRIKELKSTLTNDKIEEDHGGLEEDGDEK